MFFLIQTGRGASLEQITADACERVLHFLHDLSLTAPFGIKTTEAPHYHRVIAQRRQREPQPSPAPQQQPRSGAPLTGARRPGLRASRSVGDGRTRAIDQVPYDADHMPGSRRARS